MSDTHSPGWRHAQRHLSRVPGPVSGSARRVESAIGLRLVINLRSYGWCRSMRDQSQRARGHIHFGHLRCPATLGTTAPPPAQKTRCSCAHLRTMAGVVTGHGTHSETTILPSKRVERVRYTPAWDEMCQDTNVLGTSWQDLESIRSRGGKLVSGRAFGGNSPVRRTESRFAGFKPRHPAGRPFRAAVIDGRGRAARGSKTGKGAWGVPVPTDRTSWRARKTGGFPGPRVDSRGRDS